jgi:hypothetical protein
VKEKSPIDHLRESAGHVDIGTPDDQSAIKGFVKIDDELYIVKELGIYRFKLADEIDPDRTNAQIPNVQERLLQYGAATPFVGRTFLTASKLFDQKWFKSEIYTCPIV